VKDDRNETGTAPHCQATYVSEWNWPNTTRLYRPAHPVPQAFGCRPPKAAFALIDEVIYLPDHMPALKQIGMLHSNSTIVAGVAEAIRQLIVTSELAPGEQLRQTDLAERLQVSRIPVREALSILIAEHLVVHHPQRGFFVNKISADSFRQLRLIRNVLESAALRDMNWPDDTEIKELIRINDEIFAYGKAKDFLRMRELNSEFHDRILSYSKLNLVAGEINRLRLFADLYRHLFVWDDVKLDRSNNEHLAMIAAVRKRDSETLVAIRNQHASAFDDEVVSRVQTSAAGTVSSD
jgi:DNA-binding GntR family transcriptional regulator